jgi:hypothetical protein
LYDPATGIIHPDWNPSPAAQAVLAAVPDSVDDDEDTAMSATTEDVDPEDAQPSTVSQQSASSASSSSPSKPATSSSSPSASASTSSPAASGSAAVKAAPPAIETSGAKSSTDSKSLDAKASNVTLIFTPVNPSLNQANVPADSSSASSTDPETDGTFDSAPALDTRAYDAADADDQMEMSGSGGDVMLAGSGEGLDGDVEYPGVEGEQRPDYTAPYDWRWTKSDDESAPFAEGSFA